MSPVKRLAGGRAATLDPGCLCLGWGQPHPRLEESSARYELIADAIAAALGTLGVQTSLGEAPGEWCPGSWSVQGPSGKLAGLAQRVVTGGAWCEALIVIRAAPRLLELARQVHDVLGLEWSDPAQGELGELLPGRVDPHAALSEALAQALAERLGEVRRVGLPETVRVAARALAPEHRFS